MSFSLLGCGVDAERVARFRKFADETCPMPMVFSEAEVAHNRTLANPEVGFCASFCCKEALCKALEHPFNFPECEFLYRDAPAPHGVTLAPALRNELGILDVQVTVLSNDVPGGKSQRAHGAELVVIVNVFEEASR